MCLRIKENNWLVQRHPWATSEAHSTQWQHQWAPSSAESTQPGSLRGSHGPSLAWPVYTVFFSDVFKRIGGSHSCFSLLRCIPYACSARISHLRSFWAWVTTSGPSSPSTTAVSAPTSTSVYRGRTVQTTGPRSFSIEVGAWLRGHLARAQSSCLHLSLKAWRFLPLSESWL